VRDPRAGPRPSEHCQRDRRLSTSGFADDAEHLARLDGERDVFQDPFNAAHRDQARRFLSEQCTPAVVRRSLDEQERFAAPLWREIAAMGWIGAAIPEQFGGAGLGYEGLCVLAEEIGRVVAPVPFGSTAYLAGEAILTAGSEAQKRSLLPKLADGSAIGCLALAEVGSSR